MNSGPIHFYRHGKMHIIIEVMHEFVQTFASVLHAYYGVSWHQFVIQKFLHILFHVNVADMPEYGAGHVGLYCLPLVVDLTP